VNENAQVVLFNIFWGTQQAIKMLVVRFPESNQTKMPKCVDLIEGTIWQCFISFGFEIMEINENFWNYGSQ